MWGGWRGVGRRRRRRDSAGRVGLAVPFGASACSNSTLVKEGAQHWYDPDVSGLQFDACNYYLLQFNSIIKRVKTSDECVHLSSIELWYMIKNRILKASSFACERFILSLEIQSTLHSHNKRENHALD